jgi:arabinofuranosyltransferase
MEKQKLDSLPPHLSKLLLAASFAVLAAYIVLVSWVSDDAYITFRVVDNFLNGYGLRWNTYERVQAYTHPLWMFLHIPLYALWDNIFLVSIALSVACTMAAFAIAIRTFDRPAQLAVVCLLLPLGLSKSFVEFSTSGLENPMNHLLFATFGYLMLRMRHHPRFWFYLSLTMALALLNRLDTIVFYAPVLACLVFLKWRSMNWKHIILGATPLALWTLFSLFYYGFAFPNTKYAKLSTGIESIDYMKQGVLYLFEQYSTDLFSYMILFLMLARAIDQIKDTATSALKKTPLAPSDDHPRVFMPIAAGVFAYMAYVVCVGGDFMSGRFLSLPFFASAWLIYGYTKKLDLKRAAICAGFLIVLKWQSVSMSQESMESCIAHIENPFPEWGGSFCVKSGIADERAFYSPNRVWYHKGEFDSGRYINDRHYKTAQMLLKSPDDIYVFGALGMLGYYSGPKLRIIDPHALTDPLLARLPVVNPKAWRIGHFERSIPDGYLFSIQNNGRSDQMDPALAAYYEPLRLIVSGDLFSAERLKAILHFNLGHYDHFRKDYLRAEAAAVD